jgi:hypothetical protein
VVTEKCLYQMKKDETITLVKKVSDLEGLTTSADPKQSAFIIHFQGPLHGKDDLLIDSKTDENPDKNELFENLQAAFYLSHQQYLPKFEIPLEKKLKDYLRGKEKSLKLSDHFVE